MSESKFREKFSDFFIKDLLRLRSFIFVIVALSLLASCQSLSPQLQHDIQACYGSVEVSSITCERGAISKATAEAISAANPLADTLSAINMRELEKFGISEYLINEVIRPGLFQSLITNFNSDTGKNETPRSGTMWVISQNNHSFTLATANHVIEKLERYGMLSLSRPGIDENPLVLNLKQISIQSFPERDIAYVTVNLPPPEGLTTIPSNSDFTLSVLSASELDFAIFGFTPPLSIPDPKNERLSYLLFSTTGTATGNNATDQNIIDLHENGPYSGGGISGGPIIIFDPKNNEWIAVGILTKHGVSQFNNKGGATSHGYDLP